ncbi:hypothetical protein P154DRAFT_310489 [Amniculicola lignicola CBS 123094]|uniref:Mid2 domain-containing protein n=1 Tax=Amniculicola lignicola CBS 123094 TaxID=1392246 RepID=A0A6A5W6U8_9PLEO|nr:hypothetical protein P154DRAFT_310489 [Amniculicola lignicola CBS 123094]
MDTIGMIFPIFFPSVTILYPSSIRLQLCLSPSETLPYTLHLPCLLTVPNSFFFSNFFPPSPRVKHLTSHLPGTINEAASACAELNLYINTTVPESCKASPASKTSTSATRRLPTSSVLAANSTTQSTTGLSPALKIGIGIGVALLLIAIAIIIFFFIKLKRRRRDDRHSPLGKVGTALSPTETSYSGSGFGRPQQKMAMVTDQKGAVRGEPNMLAGYTYVPSPIVDDRLGFVQYSPGNLGANEHGHGHSRMSEVSVVTMATSAMTPTELAASPVSPQQRRPRTFEDMGVGAVETKGRHELS